MYKLVKVEILAESFGNYKKGDKIEMDESTAKACAVHKVLKVITEKVKEEK
jgi:hypothetical protein